MAEIQSRPWPVLSAKQVAYILYNVEQDKKGPLFHQLAIGDGGRVSE